MRVTQGMEQAQFLAAINQLESSIATNQNDISSGTLVHHGLGKSGRRRARLGLQPGARAEPAIHDQRQQRTEQPEHRGQRADAAAEPNAEPAQPRPRGEQRHRVPAGLERHRDPGLADSAEPLVARQHPGRQRQLHLRRLLDADATFRAQRERCDLQRRSGTAASPDRRRTDGRRGRQRGSRVQPDQERQRHGQRNRGPGQHRYGRSRSNDGLEPDRIHRRKLHHRVHGAQYLQGR